jgi:hypothetical protein
MRSSEMLLQIDKIVLVPKSRKGINSIWITSALSNLLMNLKWMESLHLIRFWVFNESRNQIPVLISCLLKTSLVLVLKDHGKTWNCLDGVEMTAHRWVRLTTPISHKSLFLVTSPNSTLSFLQSLKLFVVLPIHSCFLKTSDCSLKVPILTVNWE